MGKWIVFITVATERNSAANLRSAGKLSVAKYPLVVAAAKEAAELVVARLSRLHDVLKGSDSHDRWEFSLKADDEVNPHEFTMSQAVDDPEYAKHGTCPAWLPGVVDAAKMLLREAAEGPPVPVRSEGAVYLFASKSGEATTATVFHRAKSQSIADELFRLFIKAYPAGGAPAVHLRAAGAMAPEVRLLLDEAIDELAVYDDPDPGVYTPRASRALLERAEYSRRAKHWDSMLADGESDGPEGSFSKEKSQSDAEEPDPQNLADLVVLFMVMRDLEQIGRDYPDAMPKADHTDWMNELLAEAEVIVKRPGLEPILALMSSPILMQMDVPLRFGMLMSMAMMAHPAMAAPKGTPAEVQQAVEHAMDFCQQTASLPANTQLSRLKHLMIVSCRCPTGTSQRDFGEPARFLQMLQHYWALVSSLVSTNAHGGVGFRPHPLLHLIENLRDRIATCFGKLSTLPEAEQAAKVCDMLAGMLTEGDLDELSADPEWTDGEIQKVERFIARARLRLGPRVFLFTSAEEFFVREVEKLVGQHDAKVKTTFRQMLANADAKAAARKRSAESPAPPSTTTSSGTDAPPQVSPSPHGDPERPREQTTTTDWNDIQGKLLAKREHGEPYTSLRSLAEEFGCSDATIRKAIDKSETLSRWQAENLGSKAAPKATDLGAVVKDNTRQTTEPAPDEVVPDDEVDNIMAILMDKAKPGERAALNAMNPDERRELARAFQAQNRDDEPSPLDPDREGGGSNRVRQHKRA
jgi:hypothetical protein